MKWLSHLQAFITTLRTPGQLHAIHSLGHSFKRQQQLDSPFHLQQMNTIFCIVFPTFRIILTFRVWSGVWSVECGVWSVECGVWSVVSNQTISHISYFSFLYQLTAWKAFDRVRRNCFMVTPESESVNLSNTKQELTLVERPTFPYRIMTILPLQLTPSSLSFSKSSSRP